jgi:hypothetical protein
MGPNEPNIEDLAKQLLKKTKNDLPFEKKYVTPILRKMGVHNKVKQDAIYKAALVLLIK